MLTVESSAQDYFKQLIASEGDSGLNIRLSVLHPGTPNADCSLSFCGDGEQEADDVPFNFAGFVLYVAQSSLQWLEGAVMRYVDNGLNSELKIIAPKLKGEGPGDAASLEEQLQFFIDSEINPALASHKGFCRMVALTPDNAVVLQFGGGCHGCGMVDVTLKQGIEKRLMAQFPSVTAVKDATDHTQGENPYY